MLTLLPLLENPVATSCILLTQTTDAGGSDRAGIFHFALLSAFQQTVSAARNIDTNTRLALLSQATGMIALTFFARFEHGIAAVAAGIVMTQTIECTELPGPTVIVRLAIFVGIDNAIAAVIG